MVEQAILRDARESCWRCFSQPVGSVRADLLDDIPAALAAVEAAVAEGLVAVGYLAYEAAPAFDPALVVRGGCPLPLLAFGFFEPVGPGTPPPAADCRLGEWLPDTGRADYFRAIAAIKEAIARGETYQVNYTLRLRAAFEGDPYALARQLWRAQPTAYGAWLDLGDHALCSASPELFFSLEGEQLAGRPMKGTRPRGLSLAEDRALAAELQAAEKDRAENLMIVDMIRNDLGRVAETGSVAVPELFCVERYDSVWQMTSSVTARSRAGLTELLGALFPCASITGAPKVQTMKLIAELEASPRGAYTGAIGFVAPGRMQFNVAIRTVHVDRRRGLAEYGVGGGVVWDSTAEGEYEEWRTKAAVLTSRPPEFELLETLLWEPGSGYLLLEPHLARLTRSAEYFGYACDPARIREALRPSWDETPKRVRLRLARDGTVAVEALPLPASPPRPLRIALAAEPVDSQDRFLYHKSTHRAVYEAARAGRPEVDDVVLWNERGEVTESTIANLAILRSGRLLTPPESCGLLPGVYRELALARGWVTEAVIRVEELASAERVYLLNSVRRWVEAELVD